jgi:hypothetical protein
VSTWLFKQWPVPLVAAMALIVMLAAQRFGVIAGFPAHLPDTGAEASAVAKLQQCVDAARAGSSARCATRQEE